MALSDLCDLRDPKTGAHAHSKVMVFAVTVAVWATVTVNLFLGRRALDWPEAVLLGAILVAPYGLDGWKVLLKLRSRGTPAP